MNPVTRMPTHPGTVVRDTVVPASGLSVTEVASRLNVTRQQLHRVMSGESGVSIAMALRLGKLCGNGASIWLRMQEAYDIWHVRQKIDADLANINALAV